MLLGKLSLCFDFQEKFPALLFAGAQDPPLAGGAAGAGLMFPKHWVLYQHHFDFLKFCKKWEIMLGFKAVPALGWEPGFALVAFLRGTFG